MLILLTIVRDSIFDCHLSPNLRQMAIKNTVSSNFYLRSSIVKSVFDCSLSGVILSSQYWSALSDGCK